MVKQYPYTLKILKKKDAVYNASTGTWTEGYEHWHELAKCRDEANSGGGKIETQDGETYVYAYTVQLPKGTEPVEQGTLVRVYAGDVIRAEGNVQRFYKGQLHSMLWL